METTSTAFPPSQSACAHASALSPDEAWLPLPAAQWDAAAACHLFRRAAWSAQPADVKRALDEGLSATLDRLFPAQIVRFEKPKSVVEYENGLPAHAAKLKAAATPDEKRELQKAARERSRQSLQDMAVQWLSFAAQPQFSAQEKWVLFLGDIHVVSYEKVNRSDQIWEHHDILRRHSTGPAATLVKAVSRSPAMIRYLDLQASKRDAPNENFARELFELFVLGEGNYTEKDIKEAARAFTGYRLDRDGGFYFAPKQHDNSPKTVFGQTGAFTGDDIIDLAFRQPAAATFVPREMARFYLSDQRIDENQIATLGAWWAGQKHELRALAHRFFGSRLFFAPDYRGNFIKNPLQYYFGLLQDLRLDVTPAPRLTIAPLRQMGLHIYNPPNVRGWVGGRSWINSATLSARRQFAQGLFIPIDERKINADEKAGFDAARAAGNARFTVGDQAFRRFVDMAPEQIADVFLQVFLPVNVSAGYRESIIRHLAGDGGKQPSRILARIRDTAITLLQSPEYQLC
ncbi:MAG: DUF1800 domain-containing protein [Opitutaceae bacterium]|jgi:uncharacterized protein (DUF1800 family)|nr:DUF1800 domain-containing protein [Opitutaceae bacterium]